MPGCFLIALVLFAIGAWSRWWATPTPFYPTLISAGLFFLTLALGWTAIKAMF